MPKDILILFRSSHWTRHMRTEFVKNSGDVALSPFFIGFFVLLRHQNAHINALPAGGLVAMCGDGIGARPECGQGLLGNLEFVVVRNVTGKLHRQRAVQVDFNVFIVKNLELDSRQVFRRQSEFPPQPYIRR